MSESFDELMRREFGDDFGEAPEFAAELVELCESHGLPPEAAPRVFEEVLGVFKRLGDLRTMSEYLESEGLTRAGFRRELEALIGRHITMLLQS